MREGWIETTLGSVATWHSGATPKAGSPEYYEGGTINWATISDIRDCPISGTATKITDAGAELIGTLAPPGAVLVSMYGTIGRTGLTLVPMATNQAIAWGVADPTQCSGEFLFVLMQSMRQRLDALGRGATQRNINRQILREQKFLLPPISIQQRIVDLVDSLDAYTFALGREIEVARHVHASLVAKLVEPLPRRPLSEICTIQARLVDPRQGEFGSLPHVGIEHIEKDSGRLSALSSAGEQGVISGKYLFEPGEVIYSKIRPNLRKVAVVDFRGLCSADAYPLRPVTGLPASLLREMLLVPDVVESIVARSGRTKMPKVNRRELFSIEVPAGDPADWTAVAGLLDASRRLMDALSHEAHRSRQLRASLLTDLLSGQLSIPEGYDTVLVAV